jgi:hypothetical protein
MERRSATAQAPAAVRPPHREATQRAWAYTPPRLVVYGDVVRLTTRVGSHGKKDGGGYRRTGY